MMEWRSIPSFPAYEASDEGQIRRVGKTRCQKPHPVGRGYLRVHLHGNIRARVNRLICETFHGQAPGEEYEAAHIDGDLTNNRPSNLRWATRRENEDDKLRHGTILRGENNANSRLTADLVRLIRSTRGTQRDLADRFGVCQRTINVILNHKGWTHV